MIRKSLILVFAATLIVLPFLTVTANAYEDKSSCTGCHYQDSNVVTTVTFIDCSNGNIANYSVSVSDTYDAGEGWAVFDSNNNIANGSGNSGSFSVVAGQSYDVYGVSDSDMGIGDGKGGTDVVVINPDCGSPCTDVDGDNYALGGGACGPIDCNDGDPGIHPGAPEICTDGIDNNCNGLVDAQDSKAIDCPLQCTDNDSDGYATEGGLCGPKDCDDTYALSNPGALEDCYDGYDNDCDGLIDGADTDCGACIFTGREKGKKCNDGLDNDCNDLTDNEDPSCSSTKSGGSTQSGEGKGKTCRDGLDNDGDGQTDCDDIDCAFNRSCK